MRFYKVLLVLICCLLFCFNALAHPHPQIKPSNIKCYSHGKLIYNTEINELIWSYPFVAFYDKRTKKFMAVKGECVIVLN